ncbi:hypothetical protein OYT88_20525 [Sporolactobacillus sp. CQH2019]|uniref:hypothetical protein n=1 Tax=Sporolactobacillus sp. CQH2019 TaxID=3023512 RepID=UPI002367E130|nr:hypothetical protein [Sporolactobacillus sp. CQH2019]MDD9150907.1 hypothetical protein [Sporolactobacillus sp. CQH2019]
MKKYKKFIFCLIFIIFLLLISKITYSIDKTRITNFKDPIFVINTKTAKDGGTKEFIGFGYQIIRWRILDLNGLKVGYEIYRFPKLKDLNDGPSIELKTIPN